MFRAGLRSCVKVRGGHPGLPVPNSPYGFWGRTAALNSNLNCIWQVPTCSTITTRWWCSAFATAATSLSTTPCASDCSRAASPSCSGKRPLCITWTTGWIPRSASSPTCSSKSVDAPELARRWGSGQFPSLVSSVIASFHFNWCTFLVVEFAVLERHSASWNCVFLILYLCYLSNAHLMPASVPNR